MFALVGHTTNELLTFRGRVIVHDNDVELEWLLPGARVIKLPSTDFNLPQISIKDHPDMASVKWPLRKEDFRASV